MSPDADPDLFVRLGFPNLSSPVGLQSRLGRKICGEAAPALYIRSAIDLLDKTEKRTEYRLSMLNSELTVFFFLHCHHFHLKLDYLS